MLVVWTKHLKTQKEKQDFEKYIKGSRPLLDRFKEILEEFERSLNTSETDFTSYDKPNWDYKQADKNGYRRCLNQMRALVDIDLKETK